MNSEASNVEYELDDSIATVRLNRPEKLNAFTFAMIEQIRDAVERAAADEGVFAIIITGSGRAFSAGLDAGDLARRPRRRPRERSRYCPGWAARAVQLFAARAGSR